MERLLGQDRQEDVEVEAEGADDEHEHEDQEHLACVQRVGDPFASASHHRRPLRRFHRIELTRAHHQQAGEHGEKAGRVDREADACSERRDQHAGERGSVDARGVEDA